MLLVQGYGNWGAGGGGGGGGIDGPSDFASSVNSISTRRQIIPTHFTCPFGFSDLPTVAFSVKDQSEHTKLS